jgi:hypothetical protein
MVEKEKKAVRKRGATGGRKSESKDAASKEAVRRKEALARGSVKFVYAATVEMPAGRAFPTLADWRLMGRPKGRLVVSTAEIGHVQVGGYILCSFEFSAERVKRVSSPLAGVGLCPICMREYKKLRISGRRLLDNWKSGGFKLFGK